MFKKLAAGFLAAALVFGAAFEASAKSRYAGSGKSYSSSRSYSKPKAYSRPSAARRYTAPKSATRPRVNSTRSYAPKRGNTVINKNYYYGGGNGYRGNSGGGMGGGMGGGTGLGTAILGGAAGAVGGMMLHDALTEDEGEKALKMQQEQQRVDQAVQQQKDRDQMERIEQKLDAEQRQPDPYFQLNPDAMKMVQ